MRNIAYYISKTHSRFNKRLYIRYNSLSSSEAPGYTGQLFLNKRGGYRRVLQCSILYADYEFTYICLGKVKYREYDMYFSMDILHLEINNSEKYYIHI